MTPGGRRDCEAQAVGSGGGGASLAADRAVGVPRSSPGRQRLVGRVTCGDEGLRAVRVQFGRDKIPLCERGHLQMTFTVGETVVYPHHGAALIEEIKTRTIRGEDKLYLKLKVAQGDLTIEVPAENVDLVGVRDVVGQEGLDKVFEVLRAPYTEEPTNWSRRYKANLEKLASGDVIKVAEVVRDLSRRDADRGLSAGEKRMLAKARQILVSELALAEHTEEEKAEAILDEVLAS
jgi:CarD family transcriptional regulator